MKKLIALILVLVLALGLCSCSGMLSANGDKTVYSSSEEIQSTPEQSQSTAEESGKIDPAAVTEEDIEPLIAAYGSVVAENFSAEADFENDKCAIINSADGSKKIVTRDEIRAADGSMDASAFPGYELDPADAAYYEVTNFKTESDIRDYLNQFMLPEVYEDYLVQNFEEIDSTLYLVRGGRGYGAAACGQILSIVPGSDSIEVTVESLLFDEAYGAFILTVQDVDGVLKITSAVEEEAVG